MGATCMGSRKNDPRRVDNPSNTLSSEQHSQQQPLSNKKSTSLPLLTVKYYRHDLTRLKKHSIEVKWRVQREHRYQQFLASSRYPSTLSVQEAIREKPEPVGQSAQGRQCSTLERQYWIRSREVITQEGLSFIMGPDQELMASRAFPEFLPEKVVLVQFFNQDARVQCLFKRGEIRQIKDLSLICGQSLVSSKRQEFATPFLSGISLTFAQSNTSTSLREISQLFLLRQPLTSPGKLVLFSNPVQQSKIQVLKRQLWTYTQIATWVRQNYGDLWHCNFESLIGTAQSSRVQGYILVQLFRCVVDSSERFCMSQGRSSVEVSQRIIEGASSLLYADDALLKQICFLYKIYLTLQGITSEEEINSLSLSLVQSLIRQIGVITDGLFCEFGIEINEKQHPFRNHHNHFIEQRSDRLPLRLLLKDTLFAAPQILNSLQSFMEAVLTQQMNKQKLSEKYQSQFAKISKNPQLQHYASDVYFRDFTLRVMLLDYYISMCEGKIAQEEWKHIQNYSQKMVFLTPQTQLFYSTLSAFTLTAVKEKPGRTQVQESQYLKALELCHRLYGDPRSNRKGVRPPPQQIWECLVLEMFINQYTGAFEKKQHSYLNNIMDCLRQDLKPHATSLSSGCLVQLWEWVPVRRWSGWLVQRSEQSADSKSVFSESIASSYSSSRRTIHSSTKISQWECSVKLQGYVGVVRWGHNIVGTPHILPPLKNQEVIAIAAGNFHVVFATEEGIFGWGQNHSSQLGSSNTEKLYFKEAVCIQSMKINRHRDQVQLSCGNQHTAVLFNGWLMMWGQPQGGILAGKDHKFDSVSCGGLHTLALREGTVYGWGRGEGGQLGQPVSGLKQRKREETTDFYLDKPTQVTIPGRVIKVSCGDAHSLVLTVQGKVYVFGFCYQGQLGLGITGDSETFQMFEPVELEFKERIIDVFAGPTSSFFKNERQQVLSCGLNDCLQLGIDRVVKVFQKKKYLHRSVDLVRKAGEQEFSKPRKLDVFGRDVRLIRLECGENHCLALVDYQGRDELVMGWGLNRSYQIDAQISQNTTPRTLDPLYGLKIRQLCCGANFSLASVGEMRLTSGEATQLLRLVHSHAVGEW